MDSQPGPSRPDGDDALVPRAPDAERFAIHRRDRRALAAEHVGQHVGGVVARHHEQRREQLGGGVGLAGFQPNARAFDLGVRLVGPGEIVGPEIVEHDHREQHLDGAGRGVRAVRILRCQNLPGVHVGQQERFRRTVRKCLCACGFHGGRRVRDRCRGHRHHRAEGERGRREQSSHERRGYGSQDSFSARSGFHRISPGYSVSMPADLSWAKPQSSRAVA